VLKIKENKECRDSIMQLYTMNKPDVAKAILELVNPLKCIED